MGEPFSIPPFDRYLSDQSCIVLSHPDQLFVLGVTRPSLEARLHRLRKERDAVKAGDPATVADATRGGSEAAAANAKTKKTLHSKKGKAGAIKQKRQAEDDEDDEEGPKKKIKQSESDNDADIDGEVAEGQKGI